MNTYIYLAFSKCTFQNKVLGGFHIISIHDQDGNLIFREKPHGKAETFRPWFIANCTEKIENVEVIAETFEREVLECTDFNLDYNDQTFAMHLESYTMMDSKLIDMATGLGR